MAVPMFPIPEFRREYGHFIGGEWVAGSTGETIGLLNPATGEELARIQAGGPDDAGRAVEAAHAAFASWSQSRPGERQAILQEIARRMKARASDYAVLESLNNGKPVMEALHFDVPNAIEQFDLFSGAPWMLHGQSIDAAHALGVVLRQPIGVCVQIIPWNVPLVMLAAKIAPALAAGNTIVLKPAETVCLSIMEFVSEMADLLPPGVLNVVTGYGPAVGEALVTHPKVRKLAFTGSPQTARTLMRYAAHNIIPQTLELGGKSANIVCEDADLDAAAESAAMSMVLNKGEICLAGTRTFVHERVHDDFVQKLTDILAGVRSGDPLNPATQLGPQASQAQRDRVIGYIDIGREEGAAIATGGGAANVAGLEKGFFVQPTLFIGAENSMRIAREEIFGPVGVIIPWRDDGQVVAMANDSVYGLAGGVWTRNIARAHRMARALDTGTVWVNRYLNIMANMPIGGVKQSGFGREFSLEVLNHYTVLKSVIVNLEEGPIGVFSH
jgi:acyl-CoA reductase-like NAD-dependent aldehyde dehydrogenase